MFINYPQTEKNFIRLVEVEFYSNKLDVAAKYKRIDVLTSIHPQNRREGFFGVVERAISVVKNTYAVPKFRVLLQNKYKQRKIGGEQRLTLGFGNR